MQLGVSAFAWTADFRESHLSILPMLRDQGLEAFEIPMFNPARLPAAAIRKAMESNGIKCTVCAILPAGMNPISDQPEVRKRSMEHLSDCLQVASEMGATLLGGPLYAPIGYLPDHRPSEDEWKWAAEAFTSLTSTLDSYQIDFSLEPVNRSETFFLRTAEEARALCEQINHPRVGVTIDTFHANIEEKNISNAIHSLGKHLKHVHASENDRGLLGAGHIDFAAIVATLNSISYQGLLMIEGFGYSAQETSAPGVLWADQTVSPEDIAFQGARYLRGLLRQSRD
jgi:D-psicose/D-tagatose/L-ribulose 3-epimerase